MAAMLAYAVLATLVMAPLSTAQAEKNFWEDSGSKPSVTGSRAKAAAKAVRGNKKSYSEDENAPGPQSHEVPHACRQPRR